MIKQQVNDLTFTVIIPHISNKREFSDVNSLHPRPSLCDESLMMTIADRHKKVHLLLPTVSKTLDVLIVGLIHVYS